MVEGEQGKAASEDLKLSITLAPAAAGKKINSNTMTEAYKASRFRFLSPALFFQA